MRGKNAGKKKREERYGRAESKEKKGLSIRTREEASHERS